MHAANSAAVLRERRAHFDMVRCGIAVYGMDPFGRGSRRARARARAGAELIRRRGQALPRRGEHRLRAAVRRRARHPHRRAADRLRRRLAARAVEQRRRADRRSRDCRWSGPSAWTTSPSTSARTRPRRAVRRRGDPDRHRAVRADHRRGAGAAHGHDQLRDHLRPVRARAALYTATAPVRPAARIGERDGDPGHDAGLEVVRACPGRHAGLAGGGGALRDRAARTRDVRPRRRRSTATRERGAHDRPCRRRRCCFELSEDFSGWRVVARDRSWQVDVQPMRGGSLEADLALRDFTVSAIAEPVAGGEPIDPLGGLDDLAAAAPAYGSAAGVRRRSAARAASRAAGGRARPRGRSRDSRRRACRRARPAARLRRAGVHGAAPDRRLAARARRAGA